MNNLVDETIISYNDYLDKVKNAGTIIAEKIRGEFIQDAMNMIDSLAEGLIWMSEVKRLLALQGITVKFDERQIEEFLIEINNGIEINDYILIADMFEYEISPFLQGCDPIPKKNQ